MTHGSFEALRELAVRHLPSDVAEGWLGQLRPGLRVEAAVGSDETVGYLGGLPTLPPEVEWPTWEGHGPLSFVAAVDCAALPAGATNIDLPRDGTLLFFYFDGQLDDGTALVLVDDRESWAGARVLHVPNAPDCVEREAAVGLQPYRRVALTARKTLTAPESVHPQVMAALAPDAPCERWRDHPVNANEFSDALWEFDETVGHQLGGYPRSIQELVEFEVAQGTLGPDVPWDDPRMDEEARGWLLLAQFDSDDNAEMMWGDCGALYWLIRPKDLAERRFDRAMFTWQCS